ncbi:MAG: DUF4912 domain-containing protein, partial [Candidatus Sumerlaeota bacterium]|nr:DUF4912 domain-containing protein [Candidatus Sumerlaeota bacterium]
DEKCVADFGALTKSADEARRATTPLGSLPSSPMAPGAAPSPAAPFGDIYADPRPLAQAYGRTRLTLLVRDPEWIFAYWEVSDEDRRRFGIDGGQAPKIALRVHDVTHGDPDARGATKSYFVPVTPFAASWYLHVAAPARSWLVDLGVFDEAGRFLVIARSNRVATPRDSVSDRTDSEWMSADEERFQEVFRSSGGLSIHDVASSEGLGPMLGLRVKPQFLAGASEQFAPSSEAVSLRAPQPEAAPAPTEAPFRLVVRTELILSGETEPDAQLTICGEPVRLRPDGSFSVRFSLPDGEQILDVQAVKPTGDQRRQARVNVWKKTAAE